MTATQKQCLLAYFGFIKPKEIDGIWGPKSAEATKNLQAKLGLEDDGVWGNATDRAAKEAIVNGFAPVIDDAIEIENTTEVDADIDLADAAQYLRNDGYYHIPRGVDVRLSRNLWAHEVHCQGKGCCTESIVSKRMVDTFQAIRDDYGDSIEVTTAGGSGFRCRTHNAAVGGAVGSLHLTGDAFDLHGRNKAKLLSVVEKHITDGEIGTYNWGIHAGVWNRGFVNRFQK
ncbi:MAG: D-Ala-D-Ala carboxypeptidase family metallohydrolase [Firmicutes bacterium]|nr:D-Ala-D-Ala carboxypeptidase family metallohydrolase [Bacillota bacterium]